MQCDYHKDHGHETNRCQNLKFMIGRVIKVGHLRRYIREVDREEEFAPVIGRITTSAVAPPKPRPAINYIFGGPLDDQYQLKRRQKKLLRVATVKAQVNAV